jgi:hypothetical protein
MTGEVPAGLVAAGDRVLDELRRADGKATTLLSLVGAAMAGVIAVGTQDFSGAGGVLVWLSLVPIFASVTLLLDAIRPRLNANPVRGTWLHAAQVGPATLLETYDDTAADPVSTATEVCTLSRTALAKYRRIAVAVVLVLVGLATLVLALLLTAVTR